MSNLKIGDWVRFTEDAVKQFNITHPKKSYKVRKVSYNGLIISLDTDAIECKYKHYLELDGKGFGIGWLIKDNLRLLFEEDL